MAQMFDETFPPIVDQDDEEETDQEESLEDDEEEDLEPDEDNENVEAIM